MPHKETTEGLGKPPSPSTIINKRKRDGEDKMIDWMSEKCNRLMDKYGLSAYGFDKERDGADAEVILEVCGEETERPARLGNVVNLTDDEIERRFAAAAFAIGIDEGIDALVEFADRMLDPSDDGELDEPVPF